MAVSLPRPGSILCAALCAAGYLAAHGIQEKPLYNGKTNYTTRGSVTTAGTTLYMMQPPLYMTGRHETVGFRVQVQDEEAATQEVVTMSYVQHGPQGTPGKEVLRATYRLFGFGDQGVKAYSFLLTLGFPRPLPENVGIGIGLPPNAKWPRDGASVHGQLNVKGDSRHSRVPPPHDRNVWAFERRTPFSPPIPHGSRTLDILEVTGLYIEPVLQTYVRTPAYGLGTEDLFGPEAMYPVAARGDALGLSVQGGQIGADGEAFVFVSPRLGTPIRFPPAQKGYVYLDLQAAYPIVYARVKLDSFGVGRTAPIPFRNFPPAVRSFWLQALIYNPFTQEIELTDSVGVQGQ